ncbi:hypothetical protein [Mycobacterium sp. 236(2023)]|uniref:hypothetical protein n=1 Tax=Mycobacterium sp. 236(2023) TaxID=3038163 RepID=UPI0024156F0B|nr:hypothetical protein [Mycobacterium sp. 236(2023)]MDG4667971.1 hypothetical protein [Mycobacterium sp. 236(2023)]
MPPQGWQPPSPSHGTPPPYPQQAGRPKARPQLFSIIGVSLAVLLSAAALVVSLTRGDESAPMAPTAPPEPTASADTIIEDKALCEEIAPLMAESNNDARAWTGLGEQGTPARDAGLPEYVSTSEAWVTRIQDVLDGGQDADPALRRDLQRYIDDIRLYVTSIRPGPKQVYDSAAWTDSLVAYGGVKASCDELGIKW